MLRNWNLGGDSDTASSLLEVVNNALGSGANNSLFPTTPQQRQLEQLGYGDALKRVLQPGTSLIGNIGKVLNIPSAAEYQLVYGQGTPMERLKNIWGGPSLGEGVTAGMSPGWKKWLASFAVSAAADPLTYLFPGAETAAKTVALNLSKAVGVTMARDAITIGSRAISEEARLGAVKIAEAAARMQSIPKTVIMETISNPADYQFLHEVSTNAIAAYRAIPKTGMRWGVGKYSVGVPGLGAKNVGIAASKVGQALENIPAVRGLETAFRPGYLAEQTISAERATQELPEVMSQMARGTGLTEGQSAYRFARAKRARLPEVARTTEAGIQAAKHRAINAAMHTPVGAQGQLLAEVPSEWRRAASQLYVARHVPQAEIQQAIADFASKGDEASLASARWLEETIGGEDAANRILGQIPEQHRETVDLAATTVLPELYKGIARTELPLQVENEAMKLYGRGWRINQVERAIEAATEGNPVEEVINQFGLSQRQGRLLSETVGRIGEAPELRDEIVSGLRLQLGLPQAWQKVASTTKLRQGDQWIWGFDHLTGGQHDAEFGLRNFVSVPLSQRLKELQDPAIMDQIEVWYPREPVLSRVTSPAGYTTFMGETRPVMQRTSTPLPYYASVPPRRVLRGAQKVTRIEEHLIPGTAWHYDVPPPYELRENPAGAGMTEFPYGIARGEETKVIKPWLTGTSDIRTGLGTPLLSKKTPITEWVGGKRITIDRSSNPKVYAGLENRAQVIRESIANLDQQWEEALYGTGGRPITRRTGIPGRAYQAAEPPLGYGFPELRPPVEVPPAPAAEFKGLGTRTKPMYSAPLGRGTFDREVEELLNQQGLGVHAGRAGPGLEPAEVYRLSDVPEGEQFRSLIHPSVGTLRYGQRIVKGEKQVTAWVELKLKYPGILETPGAIELGEARKGIPLTVEATPPVPTGLPQQYGAAQRIRYVTEEYGRSYTGFKAQRDALVEELDGVRRVLGQYPTEQDFMEGMTPITVERFMPTGITQREGISPGGSNVINAMAEAHPFERPGYLPSVNPFQSLSSTRSGLGPSVMTPWERKIFSNPISREAWAQGLEQEANRLEYEAGFQTGRMSDEALNAAAAARKKANEAHPILDTLHQAYGRMAQSAIYSARQRWVGAIRGYGKTLDQLGGAKQAAAGGWVKLDAKDYQLKGLWFPKEVQNVYQRIQGTFSAMQDPQQLKSLTDLIDSGTNLWKALTLSGMTGSRWIILNVTGDMFNMWMNGFHDPAALLQGFKAMMSGAVPRDAMESTLAKLEPGILERMGQRAASALGGAETMIDNAVEGRMSLAQVRRRYLEDSSGAPISADFNLRESLGGEPAGWLKKVRPVNPLSQSFLPVKTARGMMDWIQQVEELAMIIDGLKKGMSWPEAYRRMRQSLFDYGDITSTEKTIRRYFVPFYTWTSRNLRLQLQQLLEQPGKAAAVSKFVSSAEAAAPQYPQELKPDWITEGQGIRVPGQGQPRYILPRFPVQDIGRTLTAKGFVGGLHPVINAAIQVATGVVPFSGQKVSKGEALVRAIPGVAAPYNIVSAPPERMGEVAAASVFPTRKYGIDLTKQYAGMAYERQQKVSEIVARLRREGIMEQSKQQLGTARRNRQRLSRFVTPEMLPPEGG